MQWDQWTTPPTLPSPSSDHGIESDWSSVLTSSTVSLRSNRSGGSRYSHHGQQWHRESVGHMKINLPIFKDKDMKDAITYQSSHWDLMVYCCTGCWDHTLLPYAIHSLQGYPGELVRNSGTYITLDDVLTILDEHYNNIKALDALNQELFQPWMGERDSTRLGRVSVKTPPGSCSIIPRTSSSRLHSQVEAWLLSWWAA